MAVEPFPMDSMQHISQNRHGFFAGEGLTDNIAVAQRPRGQVVKIRKEDFKGFP